MRAELRAAARRLLTRVRFGARLTADWLGVPGAGQPFETSIIYTHHFRDAKLREAWVDRDSMLTLSLKLKAPTTA